MREDFVNSDEYKKALEITNKQEELYKKVMETSTWFSPEARVKFQELSEKLNNWKNALNNMPGLIKVAEMFKYYENEVKANEGLSEIEFEEKYRFEIERSEKLGSNGWVVSEHTSPADVKYWEELLKEGEQKVAKFFEDGDIDILAVLIDGLKEKYANDEMKLYFFNGINAFENKEYMAASMYLLALLDNRVNQLIEFPQRRLTNKVRYSNAGFANQKQKDYKLLTEKKTFYSKKVFFLKMYPSLIAYLQRTFFDGEYSFEKGKEPPYLNRNWLMHGRMKRVVERYECIQILNSLSVLEFMFGEKNENTQSDLET